MNRKFENPKLLCFMVLLLFVIVSGQTEVKQKQIADDLTKITNEQRKILHEGAKYFENSQNRKLSWLLCSEGEIVSKYKVTGVNPCIEDNINGESLKTDLWSKQESIWREKSSFSMRLAKSLENEQSSIERREKGLEAKIREIKEKEIRDLAQEPNPSERELIRERSAEEQERVREEAEDDIGRYRSAYLREKEFYNEHVNKLSSEEKMIHVNLAVLNQNNPKIIFPDVVAAKFKSIEDEIQKEFPASKITEIKQRKIADIKQKFTEMNNNVSNKFNLEADYFFKVLSEVATRGNDIRISEIFSMIADNRSIKIRVMTSPKNSVIKFRKCGDENYKEHRDTSNSIIEDLPVCKYKIRVISEKGEHKCYVYDGFREKEGILFDFNVKAEKICDKTDIREDNEMCF